MELENLKVEFPNTPLMILTATASDVVEKGILQLVHSPQISKGNISRPNSSAMMMTLPSIQNCF